MAEFVDFNPTNGVTTYADGTYGDNRLQVRYEQDVSGLLDLTQIERNDGLSDRSYRRSGIALYARIPPVVIMELKNKYGVDIFQKGHMKRAMDLINSEYPHLKCTDMIHTVASNV